MLIDEKNNESYLRSLGASDKQGPADFDSISFESSSTPRKQQRTHFNMSWFFSSATWDARCLLFNKLGVPFLQLGSTEGNHLSSSRASWEIRLAPRDNPGEPWELESVSGVQVIFKYTSESEFRRAGFPSHRFAW